jgi:hypothetical protein
MTTLPVSCEMGAANATFDVLSDTPVGELGTALIAMEGWAATFPGPPPSAIAVYLHGALMSLADILESAGDACTLGEIGAITLMMTPAIRPSVALRIVFDDGSAAGILMVDDYENTAQILARLQQLYDGDVPASRVEFPSKVPGKWIVFASAFTDTTEQHLLNRVTAAVKRMPTIIRAPTPEGLAVLRVKLAPGCSSMAPEAEAPEAEAVPGGGEPNGDATQYSAGELAKLEGVIATSKSGGNNPEGRAWMSKLSAGLLTFAATNPASDKVSKTGWYRCTLCAVTNQIDSAHGGSLRHVGGTGHVKKWLAANPLAAPTADAVRASLPNVWSGARTLSTTQFKASAFKRQQKERMKQAMDAVTAVPLGSPIPGAAPNPTTPGTATVMGAATAMATNLAAMA